MARVIRGRGRVVPAEVVSASRRAAEILEEARAEADREREALRAELAAEAEAEAQGRLAAALIGVEDARQRAVEEVRERTIALSMEVARAILGEAFAAEPERVRAIVEGALERIARARWARVRAHPEDLPLLSGLAAELVADPSISRGGCVVESELGEVDARVETRLERLRRALEETR